MRFRLGIYDVRRGTMQALSCWLKGSISAMFAVIRCGTAEMFHYVQHDIALRWVALNVQCPTKQQRDRFRSRCCLELYDALSPKKHELARSVHGFVSLRGFSTGV